MPRSVAILSASRTRSSESMRPATYIVVTGHVGAQRLDDRVAAGDDLAARPWRSWRGRCARGGRPRCCRPPAALVPRLAARARSWRRGARCARRPWASGPCPRGLCGAGRRSRRSRPCWCLAHRAAALGVAWHVSRLLSSVPRTSTSGRASDQRAPEAVSSMAMPAAVSWSRMASAVAKSRAARAACARLRAAPARARRGARARRPPAARAGVPQCGASGLTPSTSVMATTRARRPRAPPRRRRRRGRCCRRAPSRGRRRAPRRRRGRRPSPRRTRSRQSRRRQVGTSGRRPAGARRRKPSIRSTAARPRSSEPSWYSMVER